MSLNTLNQQDNQNLQQTLLQCCHSQAWAKRMLTCRPFHNREALYTAAKQCWEHLTETDYLEAFSAHPKIGDINSLKKKYQATAALSEQEQSGVETASDETLQNLAAGNQRYENRFGFIFIVCATGKSAQEMLELLHMRLQHNREQEIVIAAQEQLKITLIRLEQLL